MDFVKCEHLFESSEVDGELKLRTDEDLRRALQNKSIKAVICLELALQRIYRSKQICKWASVVIMLNEVSYAAPKRAVEKMHPSS